MNHLALTLAAAALASSAFASSAFGQGSDECANATILTANVPVNFDTTLATLSATPWPCAANGAPDLWFEYTVVAGGNLVSFETCGSTYDTAIEVFSGSCGALVSEVCNDDFCGLQSTATIQSAAVGQVFLVRVGGFNGSVGLGTLVASQSTAPDCSIPDMFEDNDDCPSAAPIGDGTYPALNAEEFDNDYFAVTVENGATLTVDIFFSNADGDLDLYLWDPLIDCDTNVAGTAGGFLVRGFSATDDEQIVYVNSTGASQNLIVEIDMFTSGACNDYDLMVSGAGSGGGVGTAYCSAVANSTGVPSVLTGTGSDVAADNHLTLAVSNLPMDAFAFFLVSDTQDFVPNAGGSSGNLCLGGGIGRYSSPVQIVNSGASGSVSLMLDLTQLPQATGPVSVSAGETWNFQLWHRDVMNAAGGTSNFSNGLSVLFQ